MYFFFCVDGTDQCNSMDVKQLWDVGWYTLNWYTEHAEMKKWLYTRALYICYETSQLHAGGTPTGTSLLEDAFEKIENVDRKCGSQLQEQFLGILLVNFVLTCYLYAIVQ